MLVVSFLVTIILGVFLVTADCFLKYKPTDISVGIFNSLLLFVIGQTTAAVADKKIQTKNTREIPQNEE